LPNENVSQNWLSYPEAELYSGLRRTTIRKYIRSGEIKAARIGRAVRINRQSLDEFMDKHPTQLRLFDSDDTV
jgi:excisionase family DNA binding protein